MATVNIGADNADDAFYRYKMPKLQAKIEGRGNGIKTNIVNMVDVAKALSRPASYTTKYFGCVLGAQSKFDEKTGTSTVNGAHDQVKLAQHLEGFIKTYVQCYSCGNPETEINITKNQCITLKCAACGALSDVDMRDKLTTFILKNPPEVKKKKGDKNMRRAEKERLKAGEAVDEEAKKVKAKSKKSSAAGDGKKKKKGSAANEDDVADGEEDNADRGEGGEEDEGEEDEVEWQTDTSAEAARKRQEEQLTAAAAGMVISAEEESAPAALVSPVANGKMASTGHQQQEEEEAEEEESQAEESQAEQEEASGMTKLVHELVDYIQTHKLAEVADFVAKKEQDQDLFIALVQALFQNVAKGFAKEVCKKKVVLSAVVNDSASQAKLLTGVEHFFAHKEGPAAKEVALVLKALYDEEIIEEEDVLFSWEQSASLCPGVEAEQAASVRKLSLPFLDWLREADEEEEDDDA